jgi:hypothetical protein
MTLKGPNGATQAQLEEAGRGITARCKVAGFDKIICTVREGAIELRAPDGLDDTMQFSLAALGYFPAKKVELRILNNIPGDYWGSPKKPPCTLADIRSFENPPDSVWMPFIYLRHTKPLKFKEAIQENLYPRLVCLEPSIPLSVPLPFIFGSDKSRSAYYELTKDRRQAFGGIELTPKKVEFGLLIDGYLLSWFWLFDNKISETDQQGNPIIFTEPYLYTHLCEGYDKRVEAIISVGLPFSLTVAKE